MTCRSTMGPPASEPEQREYIVERVTSDGCIGECVTVHSHHALEACREYASARGIAGPWRDYAYGMGMWCMGNANTVIRAIASAEPDAAKRLSVAPLHFMPPTNDERAAAQRRIADAIRAVPERVAQEFAEVLCSSQIDANDRERRNTFLVLGALAAAARDDRVADALAQVRQAVILER